MIRTAPPKNARSARAAAAAAPKLVENAKTAIHIHSTSSSALLQSVLTNLHALKKPFSKKFTKKNSNMHPFDDASSLEFFSLKNDASLLVVASHSKKRPQNLVLARCFEHKLLDMVEMGIDPETWRPMESFPGEKPRVGVKPMMVFAGDAWETEEELKLVRSLWLDYFRGETTERVDVEGLQYVITFAATRPEKEGGKTKVHVRAHMIRTLRSGEKLPRVEVEEMGPRMDLSVRRVKEADAEILREAMRKPKQNVTKTKKNVEMDIMGDKLGRIHTGKQDLGKLQTRKMKALKAEKRARDEDGDTLVGDAESASEGSDDEPEVRSKKARKA